MQRDVQMNAYKVLVSRHHDGRCEADMVYPIGAGIDRELVIYDSYDHLLQAMAHAAMYRAWVIPPASFDIRIAHVEMWRKY